MSDKDSATPRVYLIRHGETEWSRNGKYTGVTDLPLLPDGEAKVRNTASVAFGPGLLIDPGRLTRIYCSPRQRATRTLQLLFEQAGNEAALPSSPVGSGHVETVISEDIAEWGYGDYEGMLTQGIKDLRKQRGHDKERSWDIWRDGTEGEGSESPAHVQERLDRLIGQITEVHGQYLQDAKDGKLEPGRKRDVLVVAHGHILRAFVKRWLGFEMATHVEMMLEPGGVCGLSYAHSNVKERAVLVGMSFPKARA